MTGQRFFLDTNIFIYAHDATDEAKTQVARELILRAHTSGYGVISDQVIREFCNVATKKFSTQMVTADIINTIITELRPLLMASSPSQLLHEDALNLRDRFSLSFYDAAIVQAASYSECGTLYSEDMQHEARYGNVTIVNPFGDV